MKALWARGILELGCSAHARRKFFELQAAGKSVIATDALLRIAELYRIEAEAPPDPAARHAHRQRQAKPLVDALFQWLIAIRSQVSDGSGTANAIDYALKREAALRRHLDDGRYPIDNNALENAIRPVALGRKNWLFTGSERAGERAASNGACAGTQREALALHDARMRKQGVLRAPLWSKECPSVLAERLERYARRSLAGA